MKVYWPSDLSSEIERYTNSLNTDNHEFKYSPSKNNLTKYGELLELGFSCYALKINYIISSKKLNDSSYVEKWSSYLNSFQSEKNIFGKNSYIDKYLVEYHKQFKFSIFFKDTLKNMANIFSNQKYETSSSKLKSYIFAETKQAISTLFQINKISKNVFLSFPKSEKDIYDKLDFFNWSKPWNAGAQFANVCMLTNTQLSSEDSLNNSKYLNSYIKTKLNSKDGLYYSGKTSDKRELVNGAMKVITGLDWINSEIHSPEKLIDFCLNYKVDFEGCDIVDVVYVLYKCSKQTEYKKKEIIQYFETLEPIVFKHYFEVEGGFSYFINKSQTHYYGVEVTKGKNLPDIHGTLLLVWAISMMEEIRESDRFNLKVIKP